MTRVIVKNIDNIITAIFCLFRKYTIDKNSGVHKMTSGLVSNANPNNKQPIRIRKFERVLFFTYEAVRYNEIRKK